MPREWCGSPRCGRASASAYSKGTQVVDRIVYDDVKMVVCTFGGED
jgi:hypothetical protein